VYGGPPGGWYGGPPPAPTPGVIPLRPLTVGELLDGAVKVIRRYPRPTLGISAAVAVLTTLMTIVVLVFADAGSLQGIQNEQDLRDAVPALLTFGTGVILVAFLGQLAYQALVGALAVVAGKAVLGEEASLEQVWQALRPRLGSLVGLWLVSSFVIAAPVLVGGLIAAGLSLLGDGGLVLGVLLVLIGVVGSVHLYVRLALSPAVLLLEKAGIQTAMSRSGHLVRNAWWRTCGLLVLTWLISQVVAGVLSLPFSVLSGFGSATGADDGTSTLLLVLAQIGGGLASFVVAPFTAGVRALLYIDRRMRAEALDLTLQAAARR
jgi:MFS family permease